jgi:steroid 5-alpha reductase family enzyme
LKNTIGSIFVILITVAFGAGIAIAGSYNGAVIFGEFPLFAFCVTLAFVINWVAFVPAYILQTEKFFDLTGSVTYMAATVVGVLFSSKMDARSLIVMVLVLIWAIRLGAFLYKRIQKDGKDGRFDELKPNFLRFLIVWTLQGLWVTFTLAAALVIFTTTVKKPLGFVAVIGILIWVIGFLIEVIADAQKSKWRANPENRGKFINIGLWSKSRHPNYFGEILLWIGIAVIAFPIMETWQYFSLISPVFVYFLLTRVSGIPLLEKRSDEKWGGKDEYEEYKKNTPVLIPKL